jgi:RNA polymerase sigma-70 factor (ECF subfamily)
VDRPDDQDVAAAQAGDRQAFAALVRRYWPGVFRWLYGLTHHTHKAEDLTQEVFLRAWISLGSLQAGSSFRAWLFRIARNSLIDSARGPRGIPPRPLPEAAADRDPGPVATAIAQESLTLVQQACARLPETYRSALLLWTQEDFSYSEIAHALEITEETARWRVCKARKLLLNELGPYLDSSPS